MPWRLFQSPRYDDATTATAVSNNWPVYSQQATASATSVYTNAGPYTTAVYAYWTNEPAPPAFRPAAPPIILTLAEEEERAREREARRADAESTARALLLRFLDDEQALELERTQSFYVIGKSGARYRICRGKVANIHVVDSPRGLDPLVGRRLCVHPADSHILPVHDVMLAQLLHLRANDVETRRIANVH